MSQIKFLLKRTVLFAFIASLLLLASCAKKTTKSKEEMGFDELKKNALVGLEQKKYDRAAEYLEKIVSKFPEHPDTPQHKLTLADTYFKMENYPSAERLYSHYSNYYPSDLKAEYAQYKAIRAQFYQTLRTDCDQTSTEQTISLCKRYRENPTFTKYGKDVQEIQNTCEHKLINKEIYVYNFYLKHKEYAAAQGRLNYLKDNYLTQKKSLEPRVLYLECKLAQKQKKATILEEKLEQLVSKYPKSQYTRMAQSLATRGKFRF
ncbi:MAG: outer membrane protein assembly factor BamD [bacterium]